MADVFPRVVPDLFVGRPVIITGRFKGKASGSLRVAGQVAGRKHTLSVAADGTGTKNDALAAVWARAKIADLSDWSVEPAGEDNAGQVKTLALEYGLMSAYTAFVAVDSKTKTAGDHGTTVAVPVPVPEGVRYETTVNPG